MTHLPIYMDNNATTRTDPRVVEVMLPYFSDVYGNAASHGHAFGWQAEAAVDGARESVAALIGADPREIVFTSGATESDNLALKGVAGAYAAQGDHLITVATEHPAVLDAARRLEADGKRITLLGVDGLGHVDINEVEAAFTDRTVLVSVMMANNETGVLQTIREIGELCRRRGVLFHSDATQAVGKVPVSVDEINADLMSLTAHKIYGPKGVGALYVRRKNPRVRLVEQMNGGGHERGFRSGTLNVPGIVGFGKAAELCLTELDRDQAHTRRLCNRLKDGLWRSIPGLTLNGHPEERLPNTLNVCFPGVESDALMAALPEVALSSGSACSSASIAPSHVLKAMGLSDTQARSAIRFSLSRFSTDEEINIVVDKVTEAVSRLQRLSFASERVPA